VLNAKQDEYPKLTPMEGAGSGQVQEKEKGLYVNRSGLACLVIT